MKPWISKLFFGALMISSLIAFSVWTFNQHAMDLGQLKRLAVNVIESKDYQFEVIVPERITLPKPGKILNFKIGFKISNKSSRPKYFCLCSTVPKIVNSDGSSGEISSFAIHDMALTRRDFEEIFPGQSKIYYKDAGFSYEDNQIVFHLENPGHESYVYYGVEPGYYWFSLNYKNNINYFPAWGSLPALDDDNTWTGEVHTSPKKIYLSQ
jgi:hypothetical protein